MLRLTQEREKRGLNKLQLSYLVKISPADIGRLESGKIFPYPGFKKKLEKFFGIPADQLFQEED